ncbi:MAG TPA: DUF6252 family protein [Lentimicrobium sp.]|nr:DUF6252 family protein [Lentimicrobium sp.]
MKKAFICTVGLIVLMVVTSCKKDEKDNDPKPSLSVKIDGVEWTATKFQATYTDLNNILQIMVATDNPLDFLHVSTIGYERGTYPLSDFGNSCTYKTYTSTFDFESDGEIIITSSDTVNNIVSGTFRFTGINSMNISESKTFTEGKFENIKYTKEHIEVK